MSGVVKAVVGASIALLAIVAIVGAYYQLTDARAEKRQLQKEAAAVRQLTPEYVILKCGNPASDDLRVLTADGSADRELRYRDTAITFYKSNTDKKWSYIAAQDERGNAIDSPESLPGLLPCLKQK